MCRSLADGGQRCAAHTRAAFRAAESTFSSGDEAWMQAAVDYASTREGAGHFESESARAGMEGRYDDEALFASALQRGLNQRKINDEARLRIIEATTQAPIVSGKPTRPVGDTSAYDSDDQVHKVFRPHDRRLNNVRFVQDPDGSVWTANKHGVVMREEPSSSLPGWNSMVFPEPVQKDRLLKVVADVDVDFKRCTCC